MSSSTAAHASKPSLDAYSDDEFEVVVERARGMWKVDDPEERARTLTEGRKGRGPHCPEREMKPAGVKERSVRGDWGQVQHYRCLRCEHEFEGKPRRMYEDDE